MCVRACVRVRIVCGMDALFISNFLFFHNLMRRQTSRRQLDQFQAIRDRPTALTFHPTKQESVRKKLTCSHALCTVFCSFFSLGLCMCVYVCAGLCVRVCVFIHSFVFFLSLSGVLFVWPLQAARRV